MQLISITDWLQHVVGQLSYEIRHFYVPVHKVEGFCCMKWLNGRNHLFVTRDHKTSQKGPFLKTEVYTAFKIHFCCEIFENLESEG